MMVGKRHNATVAAGGGGSGGSYDDIRLQTVSRVKGFEYYV